MKNETQIIHPLALTNLSASGQPGIVRSYMEAQVVPGWPPAVPKDAEFLPMEGFTSMIQVMEMRRTFEVTISQAAYNKMMFWVLNAPGEVSGYGHVVRKGNSFMIDDVLVLEQENGGSHSFISEAATYKFLMMLKKRGLGDRLHRLWWHSHNDFGAFYSSVDKEQIESLANSEFNVSIVTNKMFEPRCRVDFYRPVRYAMDHLPLKVIPDYSAKKAAELQAELDAITIKKSPRRAR